MLSAKTKKIIMKSTLEDLKKYQNDAVVNRFLETWDLSFDEAQDIFEETKKWLWLKSYNKELKDKSITLIISQSMQLIDKMWQIFIVFSKDYHDFCDKYFGYYIHYSPKSKSYYEYLIKEPEKHPKSVIKSNQKLLIAQYELIYQVLGEETFLKWYSDYVEKYTDSYMEKIWRSSYSPYENRLRSLMV